MKTSIVEFRSLQSMREGHALTELPSGAQPGLREDRTAPRHAELSWYLARCAGRREHKAEAALADAELAVYLPRIVHWRRVGPDRIRSEQALFAGYIFVGLEPEDQAIGDIEGVDGVYRVVRFTAERNPPPLRFAMIEAILRQELAGEFDRTRKARHNDPPEGSPVNIVGGMFQGFPARFIKRDDEDRVQVLLKLLGTEAKHTLEPEQVAGFVEAAA